ncbi:MAG: hypothetical protein ACTSWY_13695 [Promethearchaeota archaeon]
MSYKVKYVRSSIVKKELFQVKQGKNVTKIRISADAKDKIYKFLDSKVVEGVEELIAKLPRKSKGSNKGDLKRITILNEDFE